MPTCFPIALSASLTADVPGCHRAAGARARGGRILPGAHGELDIPLLWAPSPSAPGWRGGNLAPRRAVAHTHRFLPERLLLHLCSLHQSFSSRKAQWGGLWGGCSSSWDGIRLVPGENRSPGAASAASDPARQPSPAPSPADLPTSPWISQCLFFRLCGLVGIFFWGGRRR